MEHVLLRVRVAGLDFTSVYCPNGKTLDHPDFPRKLAWYDALRDYLAGVRRDVASVVGGDFNVRPGSPRRLAGRRRRRVDLLHRRGASPIPLAGRAGVHRPVPPPLPGGGEVLLVGLSRRRLPPRHGTAHRPCCWGTPDVVSRVRRVEIDREYRKKKDGNIASDHAPVFADLD